MTGIKADGIEGPAFSRSTRKTSSSSIVATTALVTLGGFSRGVSGMSFNMMQKELHYHRMLYILCFDSNQSEIGASNKQGIQAVNK